MNYCRYCGKEIAYKRTKNDKWLPCDASTGEPHADCMGKISGKNTKPGNGLLQCRKCGRPVFRNKSKVLIDYTSLDRHLCKKADITRYRKFLYKVKK